MGCRSSSRGLNATRHPFFSHENSLINYFVHSVQNVVFWRTTPFYFLNLMGLGVTADPKGSNQDGTKLNENTLDHNNIFWGYTHSSQGILIGCVCSSLGQSKINVGCICCTAVRRKLQLFLNFHSRISGFIYMYDFLCAGHLDWSTEVIMIMEFI